MMPYADKKQIKNTTTNKKFSHEQPAAVQSQKTQVKEKQKKSKGFHKYEIQDAHNFKYYSKFRCILSQPSKYLGVQLILQFSMLYFYIITFLNVAFIRQWLNFVIICFHILVTIVFIVLAFVNPGIIPKIHKQYEMKCFKDIPFRYSSFAINDDDQFIVYSLPIKSHHISLKYCEECLIFKPPRTVHCWTCNACIQKMDHHCPFIGNCVGKGNYSIFIIFVCGTLALTATIIGQIIFMIIKFSQKDNIQLRVSFWFCFPLLLISFVALCFVGTLLGFHIYLILNSLTTNEYCKKSWDMISGNPFSKNFFGKNIFKFIIGPSNRKRIRPSTIVDPRIDKYDKRSMSQSDQFTQSYQQKPKQQYRVNEVYSQQRLKDARHQFHKKSLTDTPAYIHQQNYQKNDKQKVYQKNSKHLDNTQKNLKQQSNQHL